MLYKLWGSGVNIIPSIFAGFVGFFVIVAIFELVFKAFALWKAAKRGDKWWFVAILILNTLGILPIIYFLTHKEKGRKKH
jgi:ABC-type phosphate transport system permease subunit